MTTGGRIRAANVLIERENRLSNSQIPKDPVSELDVGQGTQAWSTREEGLLSVSRA